MNRRRQRPLRCCLVLGRRRHEAVPGWTHGGQPWRTDSDGGNMSAWAGRASVQVTDRVRAASWQHRLAAPLHPPRAIHCVPPHTAALQVSIS